MSEIQEKEMHLIDLNSKLQYMFKIFLEEDKIHFWLKEDKIYAPFTFEESFTFDKFVENHKIFKACDDLKEIYDHLINLYAQQRIKLMSIGAKREIMLVFNIDYISEKGIETGFFTLELKMTENKDDDLLKLYKIQKDQIIALRYIQKLLKKEQLPKEKPLYKAIMGEIDKCRAKVDYK